MSTILLVEDDKKKVSDITEFISMLPKKANVIVKESYQSGLREAINSTPDLLLLDMSIPTWDVSSAETGNKFEKYGGYTILKELVRREINIPTILITMFDDFGESDSSLTLSQLDKILKKEFGSFYKGYVYYSARESKWKDELKTLLISLEA